MPHDVGHSAVVGDWLAAIPPSTTASISPPPLLPLECPSPEGQRKRKRYCQPSSRRKRARLAPSSHHARSLSAFNTSLQTNNTVSAVSMASGPSSSSAATSLTRRTILTPVPPSRKKSQSPTRKHHRLLAHGAQPINIRQPRDTEQHESVEAVHSILSKHHGFHFIHASLKERLQAANRYAFKNDVHEYMIYEDPTSSATIDYLWKKVENIYKIARACNNRKKDENAWSRVLEKVVNTALKLNNTWKLELNSVQTQNIEPKYLAPTGSSTGKKADFVLAFTNQESDVEATYRAFTSKHGYQSLSPMTDAYTSELTFACAFELKEPNGGHSEAETQLATLHTAMLLKLEDLAQVTGAIPEIPALVGWVVVGHHWHCYISTLCSDGSIEVQGPFDSLRGSTQTHHEILKLLNLFKHLCSTLLCERLWGTVHTVLTCDTSSHNTGIDLSEG